LKDDPGIDPDRSSYMDSGLHDRGDSGMKKKRNCSTCALWDNDKKECRAGHILIGDIYSSYQCFYWQEPEKDIGERDHKDQKVLF